MTDKTTDRTAAERQQRYHARNKQRGMMRVMVLVPVEDAEDIRRHAQQCRDRRQPEPEPHP